MQLPKVSVIIVNYNGKALLEKCLESLFKVNYDNFEVILIDNNSTDKSIKFVTTNYPSVIIIKLDSNKGFAEPNNIASKITTGEYLLFLNNDTIVTPNFIIELLSVFLNSSNIAICQSLLLKLDGKIDSSGDFIDSIGVVYNSTSVINDIREISSARGASMIVKKKVFTDLGGFDEKFFVSFEDVDLGWRTWINGYRVVINPKSIVYHYGGQTHDAIKTEIAFHGLKNQLAMKITNFETSFVIKSLFKFFIIYGLRELKILLDYKIKGYTNTTSTKYESKFASKPSITVIFKSILWILKNTKYLKQKHNKIKSQRKVSTKKLLEMNVLSDSIM
jgi:GT2 family glycosyltransferase|tara:strand:+ start:975 stop:1973 length:999 start_codon:yes stop_codon:yes gene_type:complete